VRRRTAVAVALAAAAAVVWPLSAAAHGLVGRADLPIPSWLFGWGASVVLVVSFVALATLWPEPRFERVRERRLFGVPRWLDPLCGAIGVALFGLVVYAGLEGTTKSAQNLAPNFVYVHFWVGLVIASVLLGDVFRAFNPWRAAGRALGWAAARAGVRSPLRRPYPDRLGRWPAVATIVGFAWLELVYTQKADPRILAWLCIGFFAVQLAAMAVYGSERWAEHGDGFSVYFNLYARLSPLVRRERVLHLRPPLSGAPGMPVVAGSVTLLCVAIGVTTFDGFSNGPVWASLNPDLQSVFKDIGFGTTPALELAGTVGLAGCIAAVTGFYRLGVRGMETIGGNHSASELAGRFAHTLIPIAFAYAVAHYFSLLVYQGQSIAYLISDPLGDGSNIFGTANSQIDYGVVSGRTIWYVQVGALVIGHVSGLILAHDRALTVYKRIRDATRSQYWMLVVMVGFTSLGLWLLSAVRQ
jgi:hypothetical protein